MYDDRMQSYIFQSAVGAISDEWTITCAARGITFYKVKLYQSTFAVACIHISIESIWTLLVTTIVEEVIRGTTRGTLRCRIASKAAGTLGWTILASIRSTNVSVGWTLINALRS